MISGPTMTREQIRWHYDLCTPFYNLLWGNHIHHGLFDGPVSPRQAQRRLIEYVADAAAIPRGADVLDIGCGMGGSSIHLARSRGCRVTGVTLSPVQRLWATTAGRLAGVSRRTRFLRADAEQVQFPAASFDRLWTIECTEHLFDKPAFFARAAAWLRPGGRFAICAWMDGARGLDEQVRKVAQAFLCPSFGSLDDYCAWLTTGGLTIEHTSDLTQRVARTWDVCEQRVRRSGVGLLARLAGRDTLEFVRHFRTLGEAYETRAMIYGCIVARRDPGPTDSDGSAG